MFATEPIARNTEVAALSGPWVSRREFEARVDAGMSPYAGMAVGRRYVVDAGMWRGAPPSVWYMMNHARPGNVHATRRRGRVMFVTTRAVAAGEELLYPYDTRTPPGWLD